MPAISESRYLVQAGWKDVPHLDERTQKELLAGTPRHLREARSTGAPSLGAGAVYPFPVEEITVDPFPIPGYWPRAAGLDVGWNRTACIWMAWDRSHDVMYLYTEHYMGQAVPSVHATAIKARGAWIPVLIDPASRGRDQKDGEQLIENYRQLGLSIRLADNGVDAGLWSCEERLGTGRLKIFKTLSNTINEYRLYRRDENGKIVKKFDHCLHGDTLVHTLSGLVKIRDLVGHQGYVLSVGGRFARYGNCRKTAVDQPLVRVSFDDGSSVVCTPDHRFLTVDGWVEACDMAGRTCENAVSQRIHRESVWLSRLSQIRSKSLKDSGTISAGSTSKEMASVFTALCGHMQAAVKSLQASMSITRTAIARTISQAISNFSPPPNTPAFTMRGTNEVSPRPLSKPLPNGTGQRQAEHGIGSTIRVPAAPFASSRRLFAINAGASTKPRFVNRTGFAQTYVSLPHEDRLRQTMSRERAQTAEPRSQLTDTAERSVVLDRAGLQCLTVEDAGTGDVYCMEVPETHAFAVASGVVAHNCMDAMRYVVHTGREHACVQPLGTMGNAIGQSGLGDEMAGY